MKQEREAVLQHNIRWDVGRHKDVRLFRNNVGRYRLPEGGYLQYGLCPGSSDLIGLRRRLITARDVGLVIAQFVSIEVKREHERATEEQEAFLRMVADFGGLSGVAHSIEEARRILLLI